MNLEVADHRGLLGPHHHMVLLEFQKGARQHWGGHMAPHQLVVHKALQGQDPHNHHQGVSRCHIALHHEGGQGSSYPEGLQVPVLQLLGSPVGRTRYKSG
jgi:hypothetical protein